MTGLNQDGTDGTTDTGTPGYIEMVNTTGTRYYLFLDSGGHLRVGSPTVVGHGASPATVGWSDASGRLVGTLY